MRAYLAACSRCVKLPIGYAEHMAKKRKQQPKQQPADDEEDIVVPGVSMSSHEVFALIREGQQRRFTPEEGERLKKVIWELGAVSEEAKRQPE